MSDAKRSRLIVRTANVMQPPLLDTTDAHMLEFRDPNNELMALIFKILSDNTWGMVTRNDPDWQATLVRYGYLDVTKPIGEIIRTGL
jgi:hypothetical protein